MTTDSLHSFSRAANRYDAQAVLHRRIAQKLAESCGTAPAAHILELGCGTGFLTACLCRRYPHAVIDAVDSSAAMIAQARRRVTGETVRWHVADARSFAAEPRYDLIASSSALQWMQPFDELAVHLYERLTGGRSFHAAVMVAGTLIELRSVRREIAPGKELSHELPTRGEIEGAFTKAGFSILSAAEETQRMWFESAEVCLSSIKSLGVTGGRFSAAAGRLTRSELQALLKKYAENFKTPQGVPATFQVLYLQAHKDHEPARHR